MESLPDIKVRTGLPKIASLYARVSTARQEEEQTIESQISEVSHKISEDGNILPEENIFIDDGWTGSVLEREGLDGLRNAVRSGALQIVYVYDRGRLSRNYVHQEVLLEEFQRAGVEFVSLHDVNATTPEESILQGMQGLFHEYERVKIAERFRRGKQHKINSGILIQGQAFYGYRYKKRTDYNPASYAINEQEARVVRMIFEWVGNDDMAQREVVRRLYDLGIKPPKGKSDFWTKGTISRILSNETYVTGELHYFKHEAIETKSSKNQYRRVKKNSRRERPKQDWKAYYTTQQIVSREIFEKVQKKLEYNQKYLHKQTKYDYLLSGFIFCQCGNRRSGDGCNKTGHRYYRCVERVLKRTAGREDKCKLSGINAQILDKTVWQELTVRLTDKQLMAQQARVWLERQAKRTTVEESKLQQLKVETSKLVDEESRYIKAYGEGLIEFEEFANLKNTIKAKLLLARGEMDKLSKKSGEGAVNESDVQELCQEAEKVLNSVGSNNRKAIIHEVIDKVIVYEGNRVEVQVHVPLHALKLGYGPENRYYWFAQCRQIYSF